MSAEAKSIPYAAVGQDNVLTELADVQPRRDVRETSLLKTWDGWRFTRLVVVVTAPGLQELQFGIGFFSSSFFSLFLGGWVVSDVRGIRRIGFCAGGPPEAGLDLFAMFSVSCFIKTKIKIKFKFSSLSLYLSLSMSVCLSVCLSLSLSLSL